MWGTWNFPTIKERNIISILSKRFCIRKQRQQINLSFNAANMWQNLKEITKYGNVYSWEILENKKGFLLNFRKLYLVNNRESERFYDFRIGIRFFDGNICS